MKPNCCFCEEAEEHIATNGPKGTKFLEYFACQKFVEMLPKTDFRNWKTKVIAFSVYFQEHHKVKENTTMECVREILCEEQITWQVSYKEACVSLSWT